MSCVDERGAREGEAEDCASSCTSDAAAVDDEATDSDCRRMRWSNTSEATS
jgi:hypothetical protein